MPSKLSKGINEIIVSENSKNSWPSSVGGTLQFSQILTKDNLIGYKTF